MISKKRVSLVLVVAMAAAASAGTIEDVQAEYWVGSGNNQAMVVIDFGAKSYAFGYKWDGGTKYGKDMLDAVKAGGGFDYGETGGFLSTISYDSYSNIGQGGWPTDWWCYFTGEDGRNWEVSAFGFAERELTNGCWDGWAHQTTDAWPPAHYPTAPVPEPSTIALVGLGSLLFRKLRV